MGKVLNRDGHVPNRHGETVDIRIQGIPIVMIPHGGTPIRHRRCPQGGSLLLLLLLRGGRTAGRRRAASAGHQIEEILASPVILPTALVAWHNDNDEEEEEEKSSCRSLYYLGDPGSISSRARNGSPSFSVFSLATESVLVIDVRRVVVRRVSQSLLCCLRYEPITPIFSGTVLPSIPAKRTPGLK